MYAIGIAATTSTISTLNLNSAKIEANSENENSSALAVGITVRDATIDNNGDGLIAENAEIQVTATSENGTADANGFNGTNLTVNDSAVINLNGLKANVEATGKDKAITRVINLENASIAGSISTENMDITATATATDSTAQAYGAYASGAKFSGDLLISGSAITATASSNGLAQGHGINLNGAELKNATIDVGTIEASAPLRNIPYPYTS